jgi:CheY-like chemotaxis protein
MSDDHESVAEGEYTTTKTIFVVEDDDSIGELLVATLLEETPYTVVLALDALEVLKLVREHHPDLLILDYQLPHMNGLELYDRLHSMQGLEGVPAILISAHPPEEKEFAKRSLTRMDKPLDLDKLLYTIERLLEKPANNC